MCPSPPNLIFSIVLAQRGQGCPVFRKPANSSAWFRPHQGHYDRSLWLSLFQCQAVKWQSFDHGPASWSPC